MPFSRTVPLALVLLVSGFLQADDPKNTKDPIGHETTSITGPVDKDGRINYEASLNDRLGKGITPEKNANVLIWKALGPNPEGGTLPAAYFTRLGIKQPEPGETYFIGSGEYFRQNKIDANLQTTFEHARQRPWIEKEFPHVAAWLKANEVPLSVIVEATRRPEYFNPLVSRRDDGQRGALLAAMLPNVQSSRDVSRALTARALLRIGQGDAARAWQDLLASHRLGRLVGRGGTLIEALVGIAIDAITTDADLVYLERANLTGREIQTHLADLQALPSLPAMADKVDLGERHMYLDSLQLIRCYGVSGVGNFVEGGPLKPASQAELMAISLLDWQTAVQDGNRYYDKLVATMRLKERRIRNPALEKVGEELRENMRRMKADTADPARALANLLGLKPQGKGTGKMIGELTLSMLVPAVAQAQSAEDRAVQRRDNLRVAFALAAYRRDHGRYPEKLNEIAPKYLPEVPIDLFASGPLVYRPSADGYLLYSVGLNGKDDAGRSFDDTPAADDMRVQMPRPK